MFKVLPELPKQNVHYIKIMYLIKVALGELQLTEVIVMETVVREGKPRPNLEIGPHNSLFYFRKSVNWDCGGFSFLTP